MIKKNKKNANIPVDLVEWSTGEIHTGTPSMVIFPAKNFQFRVSATEHKITIPKKGKYHDLAPNLFSEEEGAFDILDRENDVLYIPSITKVLLATGKYPELEPLQLFAPKFLLINEDTVDIIGQIIEMLPTTPPKKGE